MNIDASFLRAGYQSDRKEGFYAEFDATGQLTHFGYYKDGKPQGWALYLARDIYDSINTAFLCSFCGKSQTDVEKLIAGPQVFICNECIQLCNEILNEEAQNSSPASETTA